MSIVVARLEVVRLLDAQRIGPAGDALPSA
jgi:hypothetical protein